MISDKRREYNYKADQKRRARIRLLTGVEREANQKYERERKRRFRAKQKDALKW